jgi:hypothetical protein
VRFSGYDSLQQSKHASPKHSVHTTPKFSEYLAPRHSKYLSPRCTLYLLPSSLWWFLFITMLQVSLDSVCALHIGRVRCSAGD